jgi:hypothetical protein
MHVVRYIVHAIIFPQFHGIYLAMKKHAMIMALSFDNYHMHSGKLQATASLTTCTCTSDTSLPPLHRQLP